MGIWLFIVFIICYFIGCLHGSVVAQKLSGVNLKETGVRNAGASNATIVLGKKFGMLVAAIDIGKGVIAILIAHVILQWITMAPEYHALFLYIASAAVILGHVYPFYMKFDGGKGTATIIGVLLGLNWWLGLIAVAIFILATIISDYIVVGVFTLYASLMIIAIWKFPSTWTLLISIILLLVAIYKHTENFKRIRLGEEKKVSAVLGKK